MSMNKTTLGLAGLLLATLACSGADFNVLDYGATGDGTTMDTEAIREAIEACSEAGGGRVVFPAGRYLTGSIHLDDNIDLHLSGGAELLYSGDPEDSPLVQSRWEGTRVYTHGPLIYANGKKNISLTGRGRINGQGVNWWWRNTEDPARIHITGPAKEAWKNLFARIEAGEAVTRQDFELPAKFLRPSLVVFYECENVLVEGVTLFNSPMWMLHPIFCENVLISGVSFVSHGPNGDGIDIDSCSNVRVSDCYFDTEDDCIVIKSGRNVDGRRVGRPSEFITVTNCVMYRGHGAVVIGSEMSGGVRDVSASNIVCFGTDRGIRLKTARGRGGVVENLRFDNWVIHDSPSEAIQISSNYVDLPEEPFSERTPIMRNISISNITVNGAKTVINIGGLEEQPIEGLRFTDIRGRGTAGFVCNLARDIEVHDVRIDADEGPAFFLSDVEEIQLDNVGTRTSRREPVVALHNARNVWLHDSLAVRGNRTFVQVQGAASDAIIISSNELDAASTPVILGPDVPQGAVQQK